MYFSAWGRSRGDAALECKSFSSFRIFSAEAGHSHNHSTTDRMTNTGSASALASSSALALVHFGPGAIWPITGDCSDFLMISLTMN